MQRELSIIIPVFNESSIVLRNLRIVDDVAATLHVSYEIIAVDDSSVDNSFELLQQETLRLPHLKVLRSDTHRGKGYAIKTGIAVSQGKILCFIDADLAISPTYMRSFLEAIGDGYDIVIASRFIDGAVNPYSVPWSRGMLTYSCRILRLLVLGMPEIQDTQCGFKMFKGQHAREISAMTRLDRFCFDMELLSIAYKRKLRIVELPVALCYSKGSSIRIIKDAVEGLLDLLKIRINHIFRRYEI